MSARPRMGLLGGTFDPIHVGHTAAARAAHSALGFDAVTFLPSARPPHRPDSPAASGYHRLEMARLAVADEPGWQASDLELAREGPSFTYDTLIAIAAQGLMPSQIFFVTGADAFADIATWHRYPEVLDLAQFVVVARPGTALATLRQRLPALAHRMIAATAPLSESHTHILLLHAQTPDVSATDIRRRVAAGESIAGMVHPAVAAYIDRNLLYRSAGR